MLDLIGIKFQFSNQNNSSTRRKIFFVLVKMDIL